MKKIAFIFPGQGAQYVGMGKRLITEHKIAKETFEEAGDILHKDLKHIATDGRLSEIATLSNALMLVYVTSVASYRVYMKEIGVKPQFMMGHSLGEYTAFTCSGAIRFQDGVKLVNKRSELAEKISGQGLSGMTIIDQLQEEKIEELCQKLQAEGKQVYVSCRNAKQQLAVSGNLNDLSILENEAKKMGGEISPLFGNAPFHSPHMNEVIGEFEEEIEKYHYINGRIPVISNVTGELFIDYDKMKENFIMQITRPVNWAKMNQQLEQYGVNMTIEFGPKNTLTKFINTNTPSIDTYYMDNKSDYKKIMDTLKMDEMYTRHVPDIITKCLGVSVSTPNSCTDNQLYEQNVVANYRKIQELQEKQLENGENEERNTEALNLLACILEQKGIERDEISEYMEEIIDQTGSFYQYRYEPSSNSIRRN